MKTSVIKGFNKRWNTIIHKRIAQHFNLYTQVFNFSTYTICAHRNKISVYDMANEKWIHTYNVEGGFVRDIMLKRKQNVDFDDEDIDIFDKYDIIVFSGG